MPDSAAHSDLKHQDNFLGKGAFGGVYKVRVQGVWEAWKFVTIDTMATCLYKRNKPKGFDGKVWDRLHVQSRMKEMRGFKYLL